jgi:hypothetical protein
MSNPELGINHEELAKRESFIASLEAIVEALQMGEFEDHEYSIADLAMQELGDGTNGDVAVYWQGLAEEPRNFVVDQIGEFFGVNLAATNIPEDAVEKTIGKMKFKVFILKTEIEGITIVGRAFTDNPDYHIEYHLQSNIQEESN